MNDKITYFFPKVFHRIYRRVNRIWEYLPVKKISLWGMGSVVSKNELVCRLQGMLGVFTTEFFNDMRSEERMIVLKCADQTFNHDFDILGSGVTHLDTIPWHSDLKTGFSWPKGVYYRYQKGKTSADADIKVPWELSRCHHLLWLGEAYLITRDERYAREVVDEINNWIDSNPLMYSVNWTCPMDVAIRAVNWMYALCLIAESDSLTDEFAGKVYKSLFQHGFFIRNHLEKSVPYSNNHYFSDIVGLLYLGELFGNTLCGRRWFRFALREFYKEIGSQVLPSGIHYEKSVSYHRLMVELCSYPIYMLKRCGHTVPSKSIDSVRRMYEYVANYTKPNGYAPMLADNDDGRFLPFVKRDFRQHGYLNDETSLDTRIICNGVGEMFATTAVSTHLYEDAGVAIVRSNDAYLLVSSVGYSRKPKDDVMYLGTHTHNDLLSFELSIAGQDVVIDSGTYLYTSSANDRNQFRSTFKHNTVIVDDEEQNILPAEGGFVVRRNVRIGTLSLSENTVKGSYQTIQGCMSHNRRFDLQEGRLTIADVVHKSGPGHQGHLCFHFAEGLKPVSEEDKVRLVIDGYEVIIYNADCDVSVNADTWSPSYGILRHNKFADFKFVFDDGKSLSTIIQWIKK